MFENIIVFNAQDLSLILEYLERDTIPAYQDVVVNSSGESLEFSFLLLGNLRNQYASYNKAGRYLDRGHAKENLMKFEQGFFAKVIDFPCSNFSVACSVLNKDHDYSLKLKQLF